MVACAVVTGIFYRCLIRLGNSASNGKARSAEGKDISFEFVHVGECRKCACHVLFDYADAHSQVACNLRVTESVQPVHKKLQVPQMNTLGSVSVSTPTCLKARVCIEGIYKHRHAR